MTGSILTARKRAPWYTATLGGMASYLDGASLITVGYSVVLFQQQLHLGPAAVGALMAALTFGFATGAIVGGRLGDLLGRRRIYSVDLLIYAAAVLTVILAPNATVLFIGILVIGLAMGADIPTSLALVFEEAPQGRRGRAIAFSQTLWLTGVLISQGIAFFVAGLGGVGARILFAHLLVVSLVVWVLRRGVLESVSWEASRQAAKAGGTGSLRAVFRKPFGRALVVTGLVFALTATIPNTLGQFNAYLVVNLAHADTRTATILGFVSLAVGVGTAYLFQRVVDTKYRMGWFVVGIGFLVAGPVVAIVGGFGLAAIAFAGIANSIGSNFAGEAIYKVWTQELFPTSIRSTAQGLTYGVARYGLAGLSYVTPLLAASSPTALMVFLIVVAPIAGLVGLVFVPRLPKRGEQDLVHAATDTVPMDAPRASAAATAPSV